MVTLDDVRQGVMAKLEEFKEPDTPIYGEEIEQGFKEPCFFVKLLRTSQEHRLSSRYRRNHLFDIHYFPGSGPNKNEHLLTMAENLYDHLEIVSVNGCLVQGIDMRHEMIDHVLHFFVRYTFHVRREEAKHERMGYLHQEGVLKSE